MPSIIPQQQSSIQSQQIAVPQEVPVSADELYATYLQEERVKNVISQISPDNQLLDIQWRIKGYVKNPLTQQWEKVGGDETKEISPLLVSRFISYLSSLLNQNVTLSNLSGPEINSIMNLVIEWTIDDLRSNSTIYNIGNDYSERTRVCHILWNNVFTAMKRALNGMESRRIFRALSVTENMGQTPNKRGLLDYLKVWK